MLEKQNNLSKISKYNVFIFFACMSYTLSPMTAIFKNKNLGKIDPNSKKYFYNSIQNLSHFRERFFSSYDLDVAGNINSTLPL